MLRRRSTLFELGGTHNYGMQATPLTVVLFHRRQLGAPDAGR